jgi:hypothetical protein
MNELSGMFEGPEVRAEAAPPRSAPTASAINGDEIGIFHFSIWVKELDSICEKLNRQGVKFAPSNTGAKTNGDVVQRLRRGPGRNPYPVGRVAA